MTPLVTVGIPVYNGERYLSEALESIQQQTLGDIEILIGDNGSTDATEDICRAVQATDPRVKYLRSDVNLGGPHNMNRLVQQASGEFFKWNCYDDRCRVDLLQGCVEALKSSDQVLAYPRVLKIDANSVITGAHNDAELGLDDPRPHVRLARLFTTMAEQALYGVIRTDALQGTHGIQRTVADGYVLLTELILQGRFAPVDAQSLLMRYHDSQHGGDRKSEMRWLGMRRRDRLFGYTRVSGRLYAIVLRSSLSPVEKAKCLYVISRHWTLRNWRSSASDVKHLVSDLRSV